MLSSVESLLVKFLCQTDLTLCFLAVLSVSVDVGQPDLLAGSQHRRGCGRQLSGGLSRINGSRRR